MPCINSQKQELRIVRHVYRSDPDQSSTGLSARYSAPSSPDSCPGQKAGSAVQWGRTQGRRERGMGGKSPPASLLWPLKLSCPHFGHCLGFCYAWNWRPALFSDQCPLDPTVPVWGFLLWAERLPSTPSSLGLFQLQGSPCLFAIPHRGAWC